MLQKKKSCCFICDMCGNLCHNPTANINNANNANYLLGCLSYCSTTLIQKHMQLTLCFQYDIDKDQVLVKNSKESESPSKLISVIIIVSTFKKLVVANCPQSKPTVIQFHVCNYYLSVNHRLHMQNQFERKLCPLSVSYISYPILLNSEIDRLISKQQIKLLVIQFISGSQAFRMDFNKQSVAQIVKIKCRVCTRELYRNKCALATESSWYVWSRSL